MFAQTVSDLVIFGSKKILAHIAQKMVVTNEIGLVRENLGHGFENPYIIGSPSVSAS